MNSVENSYNKYKDAFTESIDSKMNVKIDYEKKCVDLTWVDIFEDTIRYIDNIVKNPKKFIINEEEIVKVELAKRVTVESVIHLTQHTNLITDYDPVKGDVKPSKILNINKEESLDTYENRVIFTLIKRMNTFLFEHEKDSDIDSYCNDIKSIEYKANTIMENEKVNLSLKLDSNDSGSIAVGTKNGIGIKERLKRIDVQMAGLINSELYKALDKLKVPNVNPPVRRTNVILKNPNFIKAMDLWNFLYNFDGKNYTITKDNQDYMDNSFAKEQFDETFLFNYMILNSITDYSSKLTTSKIVELTVSKIVDTILDNDEEISKKDFDEIIGKEYKKAKENIKNRDEIISNVFNQRFDKIIKSFDESCKILKEG